MFSDAKGVFSSVTIWGALVAIIATVAQLFGYNIGDTNGLAEQIAALVGGAIAVYGRIRATTKIGKK